MVSTMYAYESGSFIKFSVMINLLKPCIEWHSLLFLFYADHFEKEILEKAMKYLQQRTCIKFIEIEPNYEVHVHGHYVVFISSTEER